MRNNDWNQQVSKKLRSVRRERGWSLDVTAKMTNVSKAMLGQIERGESSPTITTLWKLAVGFKLPFSALVPDDDGPTQDKKKILSTDQDMEVTPVFPVRDGVKLEIFDIRLLGPRVQKSEPHPAKAIEHIIVQKGEMKVFCDGKWHNLDPSISLRFNADQPHRYAAISDTVRFYSIIYYP